MVIPAVPAPQQQGAAAPKCSKVSQLGPVNTYFKSHFLGMGTQKFKTSGVRPRPKTYAYVTVRRTGHGQLCENMRGMELTTGLEEACLGAQFLSPCVTVVCLCFPRRMQRLFHPDNDLLFSFLLFLNMIRLSTNIKKKSFRIHARHGARPWSYGGLPRCSVLVPVRPGVLVLYLFQCIC